MCVIKMHVRFFRDKYLGTGTLIIIPNNVLIYNIFKMLLKINIAILYYYNISDL